MVPSMHSPEKIAFVFTALSHKRRVLIYRTLKTAGAKGLNHGALMSLTRLAPMTLTHHLKPMMAAGLVRRKKQGAFAYYSLNTAALLDVVDAFTAEPAARPRAA